MQKKSGGESRFEISIITHFRFDVSSQTMGPEPSRFHEHFVRYKRQAVEVELHLDSLRGHCHVIRNHAGQLDN
jgi:hypothetical protein